MLAKPIDETPLVVRGPQDQIGGDPARQGDEFLAREMGGPIWGF